MRLRAAKKKLFVLCDCFRRSSSRDSQRDTVDMYIGMYFLSVAVDKSEIIDKT